MRKIEIKSGKQTSAMWTTHCSQSTAMPYASPMRAELLDEINGPGPLGPRHAASSGLRDSESRTPKTGLLLAFCQ